MSTDTLPLTALVPEARGGLIEIYDQHAALKLTVVEREGARLVDEEWDVPGTYILLDRPDEDGVWGAYVGKAPSGVRNRLGAHIRNKDHWYRAVLIRRDTTHGFNSAQVGWLEGRMYDLLAAAENAVLHNGNRPSDETLPAYDRQMLELAILPVTRVLRLLAHDPASADDVAEIGGSAPKRPRTSRFYGIGLEEIIRAGLLAAGTKLVSVNGSWPASAVVSKNERIEYQGKEYSSPSTAAGVVRGGAANGWDFWAVETDTGRVTLATLRQRFLDATNSPTPSDVERA
jgi:hypothetical protein